jgi:TetR/AcrR family transcriptional regulator
MNPKRPTQGNLPAKESLRRAAAELFARKGYAASSTREICQRAGVTKPVLYYHFGNKAQLCEELLMDAANEYHRGLCHASHRGHSAREKLIGVLNAIFAFARRKHNEYRLAVRMVVAPEEESPTIDFVAISRADERLLTEVLREGVRKGEVKGRPRQIASALYRIAFSCVLGHVLTGTPSLDRKLARDTVNLVLEGGGSNIPTGKRQ